MNFDKPDQSYSCYLGRSLLPRLPVSLQLRPGAVYVIGGSGKNFSGSLKISFGTVTQYYSAQILSLREPLPASAPGVQTPSYPQNSTPCCWGRGAAREGRPAFQAGLSG